MSIPSWRPLAAVLALAAVHAAAVFAPDAAWAQAGRKKIEGCLISYDTAANQMVIKDRRSKKDVEFRVKQAASVLDKAGTVATMDGRKAQLVDLETNRPVYAYWVVDPENKDGKFANKVDQPDAIDEETGKPDVDLMEDFACKVDQ